MYVKIINCAGWYKNYDFLNSIYEVENKVQNRIGDFCYYLKDSNHFISEEDCKVINLESENKISEEFANKLAEQIVTVRCKKCIHDFSLRESREESIKLTKKEWKQAGYIKQSREQELKKEIKNLENNEWYKKSELQ